MADEVSRRDFMKRSAVAAAGVSTALSASRVHGANDRIRLGVIGPANRGGQLIAAARQFDDVEIAALADVDLSQMERWEEDLPGSVPEYQDYRDMYDNEALDGVIIATPDHWHALQTIHACEAGLDVFVEKPLSMTIHEGRKMVEAAREHGRVVQDGLQRRSAQLYHELRDLVRDGTIGKVTVSRAYRISNMYPNGIGKSEPTDPPDHLDWDMWLGPRAYRPYQDNITPYDFRWWSDYSSQLANWGVHYFDLIRWMLGEEAPRWISAHGGRYAIDDDRTIPDTLEVVFEFDSGGLLIFGQYEASNHRMFPFGDIELRGTDGVVYSSWQRFEVIPETGGQFHSNEPRMDPIERSSDQSDPTAAHMRNFLDCIKSRETPNSDIESGHRSNTFALLGNIALQTRSHLEWDAENERFVNNDAANELLHYDYRSPWTLG